MKSRNSLVVTINRLTLLLFAMAVGANVSAQSLEIKVGKRLRAIPQVCESLTPASIEEALNVPALTKEAICKGAGDMMVEYTYVLDLVRRERKKTQIEEKAWTYEVFIPTLKSGTRSKGVLVLTSHDGILVTPQELEKSRIRAANVLEDEEEKISRKETVPETPIRGAEGMQPLGTYGRVNLRNTVVLDVNTFLLNSDLTLLRREMQDSREKLVFRFTPRSDAQLAEKERYVSQLTGEIWIDVSDHIATRLLAWPKAEGTAQKQRPPAIAFEMLRLTAGVWLPAMTRINGVEYPGLFSGLAVDAKSTYSNYMRFSTEVNGAELDATKP